MKYERDYRAERLTDSEYLIAVKTMPHQQTPEQRELRRQINANQASIDIRWGFFDDGLWAAIKRSIYKIVVHHFMRKHKRELIEIITDDDTPGETYDEDDE